MAWRRSSLCAKGRVYHLRATGQQQPCTLEGAALLSGLERRIDPLGAGLLNLAVLTLALFDGAMPYDPRRRGAAVVTRCFVRILQGGSSNRRRTAFRRGSVGGGTGAKTPGEADRRTNRPPCMQPQNPPPQVCSADQEPAVLTGNRDAGFSVR